MGDVSVIARIFPEDPAKLEEIRKELEKVMKVADAKIEDIGFGVKILRVMVIVPDTEGGSIEEKMSKIPGVNQVQVEDVSLV